MIHYWTEEEKAVLEQAESLPKLVDIALAVLSRMPQPIVQVCGPISTGGAGDMVANMRRFRAAVDVLNEEGFFVFDQLPFQEAMIRITSFIEGGKYPTEVLDVFYHAIFNSGYVKKAYFLPGWESSFGARWERNLLSSLQIEILDFPEDLFEKVIYKEGVGNLL